MITLTIDGRKVEAKKGETILQAARRAGLYIPTMCYLTKVKPIASCRLCVVEVEGADGFILSCQAPALDGMEVRTNSPELFSHRQNIMKLYDVNHPLECGVCDKSGACDLQNKTLEFGVDTQEFSARDHKRDLRKWQFIGYDESLCILCEKCVHVCNEVIGDDAIEIHYGGYNSRIQPKGTEELECTNCGECIAVCPVGAMISTDFQYKANAWELEKIPATCAHCSAGCALNYERKYEGALEKNEPKIYRVTNEFEFSTLCGAGRFGYDFENRVAGRDEAAFKKALEAFRKADTIRFTSRITNEEAMILQRLKEKYGYRLVNKDAGNYRKFLEAYATMSGKSLFNGSLESLADADGIIVLGTRILTDNPAVRYHITMASKRHNARVVYMHPMEDEEMKNVVTQFVKYEVGTEEGVLALLAKTMLEGKIDVKKIEGFLKDLDEGYLSAESNVGEEELEAVKTSLARCRRIALVVGEDCINHPRATQIARLAALFERFGGISVLPVAPKTNSLGVALICDLDDESEGYTIGYNTPGDFVLSSLGEGDLDMPALNQQEGTFTTLNKRVVPTNVALPFKGYVLNDIANALGVEAEFTIDYTERLPKEKGFEAVRFDDIPYYFSNSEGEVRGYELRRLKHGVDSSLEDIAELPEFNGPILYRCDPVLQFGPQTYRASQLEGEEPVLYGAQQFAVAAKLQEGMRVRVNVGGVEMERVFKIDPTLKGTIALNPTFDLGLSEDLLSSNYRYSQSKIEVVGQANE
ncbi:2Fe-2S iron-sulfur cluster-binding protein [Hydrogenimonas sp.]|uniref:2Fe-2S iron-sulfur cluster-binding protein n=1 Tax=Hydrogenimonas sp. TaxID=2231112 RepID=UPI002613B439|nr:2Fe-2S iron-sulfur cluster-binding protein [Hydrogenimonas sp.]